MKLRIPHLPQRERPPINLVFAQLLTRGAHAMTGIVIHS